jgi:hypothetical protein
MPKETAKTDPSRPLAEPKEADIYDGPLGPEPVRWLDSATFLSAYIPDFVVRDAAMFFVPRLASAKEAYIGLPRGALDRWSAYFTKKGWRFLHTPPGERGAEGPYRVRPGNCRVEILESGRIFQPRPQLRLGADGPTIPISGIEKRKPFDPWKPTYIRALNFIKRYEPIRPIPREASYSLWEIEECGEVSGGTSYENARLILTEIARSNDDVRAVIADVFQSRPEDFPLGSEVYLMMLGGLDDEGFRTVCGFHSHPQRLKRRHVALALGKLGRREGLDTLIQLVDDHEAEVREAALQAIGKVGVPKDHPQRERIAALLESPQLSHQVWAAEALLRGGDAEMEKFLVHLVKEKDQPLYHMGELGKVLKDLGLVQTVPFLLKRLKSDRVEIRDDAAEVLRDLTGLNLEYPSSGNSEICRESTRQWKNWWEELKKTRRQVVFEEE